MLRRMAGWSSGVPMVSSWKASGSLMAAWTTPAGRCATCRTKRHSHFRWSQMVQLNSAVRSRITPWSVMPAYSSSGSSSGGSSQDAASATRARLTLSDLTSCASGSDCRNNSSTASCFAPRVAPSRFSRRLVIMGALGSGMPRSRRSSNSEAAATDHVLVRPSSGDGLAEQPRAKHKPRRVFDLFGDAEGAVHGGLFVGGHAFNLQAKAERPASRGGPSYPAVAFAGSRPTPSVPVWRPGGAYLAAGRRLTPKVK